MADPPDEGIHCTGAGRYRPACRPHTSLRRSSLCANPRIIFFDIDGTEPDLDDYFAVAKSTVPVSPDFDAMAFGADNSLI